MGTSLYPREPTVTKLRSRTSSRCPIASTTMSVMIRMPSVVAMRDRAPGPAHISVINGK
jgi:hypothetical protein